MVFAGIYPVEADDYPELRESLEKLQLNDASLTYTPETSQALGFGFRAGFLGLFHMEIIQERIEREYNLDVLFTAPSVEYEVVMIGDKVITVDSPAELPDESKVIEIREPWMNIEIITPTDYYGPIMELVTKKRGIFNVLVPIEALDRGHAWFTVDGRAVRRPVTIGIRGLTDAEVTAGAAAGDQAIVDAVARGVGAGDRIRAVPRARP